MKREKPDKRADDEKPGPNPARLRIDPDNLGDAMRRIVSAGKPEPTKKKARRKK